MEYMITKCIIQLRLKEDFTLNPIKWFKRDKKYAAIAIFILLLELPIRLFVRAVWLVCFVPASVFKKADNYLN